VTLLLVPTARGTAWGRLAILLLAWISAGATLRRTTLGRPLLTILTLGRRPTVLALTWRGSAILALSLRWVLALGWSTVLALRRLLSVALLRRTTVLADRRWVRLLVLSVITSVNGAKKELDHPKVRSEVDRRIRMSHFILLVLKV
jgi:hypothetical protein